SGLCTAVWRHCATGARARGTSRGSRRRSRAWVRQASTAPRGGLPDASGLAGGAPDLALPARPAGGRRRGLRLQELQGLDVEEARRLREDVRVAQRLHALLGAVEGPPAGADRPE